MAGRTKTRSPRGRGWGAPERLRFSQLPLVADGRGVKPGRREVGRPEVLGDGEKRSDLECGPRAKKAWGHGTVGWGGCGSDDSVKRLPTVSGQQTHLSGGFSSSKLPHTHVCMCTHPHTHTGASHTHAYTPRYTHDRHGETRPQHRCTEGYTHTARTSRAQTRIHPLQPSLEGAVLSASLSPGQGLQLPLAGPGQVLASLRQRQRSLRAAQPQPSPDHTLCVLLCPPQWELPRACGRCGRGAQCLLNKWSWFPSLSPVLLPHTLLSPKQDPHSPASHQFSLIPCLSQTDTPSQRGQG